MMNDANKTVGRKNSLFKGKKGLVSLCLALVAVMACVGIMSSRGANAPTPSNDEGASSFVVPPEERQTSEEGESQGMRIGNDPLYGDYELGTVLVTVDKSADLQRVSATLEDLELAKTKDVSDQDASLGFVSVEVDDTVPIGQALATFETAGLRAQPNYIYYPAEGEQEDPEVFQPAMSFAFPLILQEDGDSGDSLSTASVSPNDPGAKNEWYLTSLNAYKAWSIQTADGSYGNAQSPVSVAVIDTGCLTTHEDLRENIVATYNCVKGLQGAENVEDEGGHGTHVAGIVSARANNGVGTAGTSYNAGLVIIKGNNGLDDSGNPAFDTKDVAKAYQWLTSPADDGLTAAEKYNVRVVNMSLGGNGAINKDDIIYSNITAAKDEGILTVCAAGNKSSLAAPYSVIPGDYGDCFTVINLNHSAAGAPGSSTAANDASGEFYVYRSDRSNYNVSDDEASCTKSISAPGTEIYSTVFTGDSDYDYKDGTSMASPAVAGIAALAFAYDPDLSPDQVCTLIERTAKDINTPNWDAETGYGEVDAYHALQVLSARVDIDGVPYNGTAELAVKCGDGSTLPASEWTWVSSDQGVVRVDSNEGTARAIMLGTVTITAKHPSGIKISKTVDVVPADLSQAQVSFAQDQPNVYTGSSVTPSIASVVLDGMELSESDYTVSYENNVNAGSEASVIITGVGERYGGQARVNFTIDPADISRATVDDIAHQGWRGTAIMPTPVVRDGSTELRSDIDYTVSYRNNEGPGTASVVVTGTGNYSGELSKDFVILPDISHAVLASVDPVVYNGREQKPTPSVSLEGAGELVAGKDFDYEYKDNVNAGTAHVRIVGRGDFAGATDFEQCSFVVEPRDISSAQATIADQVHTGSPVKPEPPVTLDGTALVKGVDYDIVYSNNTNTGLATATFVGKGNYVGDFSVQFKINGGELDPMMVTVRSAPTYSGSPLTPSLIVRTDGGTKLIEHKDYVILGYENNVNAGDNTATVIVQGKGSYTGTVRAKFSILRTPIARATVKVNSQKHTGSALTPNPEVTLSGYGTLNRGTDYDVSWSNNTNVGTATVTVVGKGNYVGTATGEFAITSSSGSQSGQQNQGSSNNSSNSSNSSNNNTSSSNNSSATQSSRVTGSWVYSAAKGRWWYAYDTATQSAQRKSYPASEWVTIGGKKYHFDSAGWMHSGWMILGGYWYWLGSDGAMKTGWHYVNGAWYYMDSDGAMLTGKRPIGNQTYFLTSSGAMKTGWNLEGGTWYFYNGSGAMAKGWVYTGGQWYFLDKSSGAMKQFWLDDGGNTYFLLKSGAMLTGWASIDGTWYYFNSSGAMVKNRWIGNYYVGSNGAMATNTWIGNYHVNSNGLWDATR